MPIVALPRPVYLPAMRAIIAITNSNPLSVTTSLDGIVPGNHDYIDGLIIRLDIPVGFGMIQADKLFGPVTVTSPTTFTMPIDSTYFDTFVIPTTFPESEQNAQSVPFAELNSQLTGATANNL
jgi:hypothetical protein